MKITYNAFSKSGPQPKEGPIEGARLMIFGADHNTRWKTCSKKTARELLEQADERPGMLTASQRETLEGLAGKQYKKPDPYSRRKGEPVEEYIRRINRTLGK